MIRQEEECTPTSSWWEDVQHHHNHHNDHVNSTSFYHIRTNDPNANANANSNSNARCEEEDDELSISMANTSNHLGLTTVASTYRQSASSSNHMFQDHVVSSHNHPWNLAFLPSRSLEDQMMNHNHNHHHITSSTNSSEIPFDTSNDNGNSNGNDNGNGNGNGNGWMYNTNQVRYDESNDQRLSNSSDHIGKYWSIALPNNPDMIYDHNSQTNNNILYNRSSQALEVKTEENDLDLCYNNNGLSVNGLMLSNQLRDINHSFKPLSLSEFTKKDEQSVSHSQVIVKSATTNAGKKKRYEENSDEVSKKAKCAGASTLSPEKELPKAKLREKITTLQQIVSPFGKTDTASVLQETITYINFYQEQIKLLSTPYMKNSPIKNHEWGGWERVEEKRRQKTHIDLRSRGLCLVPICYTPLAYHHHHHDHHHHHHHTSSTPLYR